ncbi:MAG: ribbon-helix-helix protein, CopG family [bacterium]
MRTTVRLDDELLERLKAQARRENVSLARLLNRTLRAGMQAGARPAKRRAYREQPHAMGAPRAALDKSLALAAALEDGEVVRELALRK